MFILLIAVILESFIILGATYFYLSSDKISKSYISVVTGTVFNIIKNITDSNKISSSFEVDLGNINESDMNFIQNAIKSDLIKEMGIQINSAEFVNSKLIVNFDLNSETLDS